MINKTSILTLSALLVVCGLWTSLVAQIDVAGPTASERLHRYGIDTTSVESVSKALHDDRLFVSSLAARVLADRGVTAAVPEIRVKFVDARDWGIFGFEYLFSLHQLGDPDLKPLLLEYVDSVYANHKRDSWDYYVSGAVTVVRWLSELSDYSRMDFVIDVLQNSAWADAEAAGALALFSKDTSTNRRERIYSVLAPLVRSHPSRSVRWGGIKGLEEYIDRPQTFDLLFNSAEQDADPVVRVDATGLLAEHYGDLRVVFDLLVRRLNTAPNSFEQLYTLDHLKQSSFPEVLDVFKAFLQATVNDTVKGSVEFAYEEYVPPVPRPTTLVARMLDTLISYKHQVFALGWLGDKNFVNELDNGLDNAKKHLAKGDSVNTYKEVQKFQEKIQKEYDKTQENEKKNKPRDKRFVTTEGYKFLFYNAKYILDRLPGEKTKKK